MNLHTPERGAEESQAQYRARREASRQAAKVTAPGSHTPAKLSKKHAELVKRLVQRKAATGQNPKFVAVRKNKPKKAIAATWPRTDDQSKQSRPLIILGKNRERDPGKRQKPKSAVAKRMDRPHRSAMMEAGHAKLMKFFGV